MKNKVFYDVVSKTKLIDVFTKNKVMLKTYFGELVRNPWALDFSDAKTVQELMEAPIWSSQPFTPEQLYRRNGVMTITPDTHGIILTGSGSGSSGRAGFRYSLPEIITDKKVIYEVEVRVNKTVDTPTYGQNTTLFATWLPGSDGQGPLGFELQPIAVACRTPETSRSVAWPSGVTIYDDLTLRLEYGLKTGKAKWYVNGELIYQTTIPTEYKPAEIAQINIAGTSSAGAQPESNVKVYSTDITLEEDSGAITTTLYAMPTVGQAWYDTVEKLSSDDSVYYNDTDGAKTILSTTGRDLVVNDEHHHLDWVANQSNSFVVKHPLIDSGKLEYTVSVKTFTGETSNVNWNDSPLFQIGTLSHIPNQSKEYMSSATPISFGPSFQEPDHDKDNFTIMSKNVYTQPYPNSEAIATQAYWGDHMVSGPYTYKITYDFDNGTYSYGRPYTTFASGNLRDLPYFRSNTDLAEKPNSYAIILVNSDNTAKAELNNVRVDWTHEV